MQGSEAAVVVVGEKTSPQRKRGGSHAQTSAPNWAACACVTQASPARCFCARCPSRDRGCMSACVGCGGPPRPVPTDRALLSSARRAEWPSSAWRAARHAMMSCSTSNRLRWVMKSAPGRAQWWSKEGRGEDSEWVGAPSGPETEGSQGCERGLHGLARNSRGG